MYDVLNDFDSVTKERDDKLGNQNALVVKGKNGKSFVLVTEKGKAKAEVKTFYKKKEHPSMPDAKSPGLNAQSDSKGVILDSNITQEQENNNKNFESHFETGTFTHTKTEETENIYNGFIDTLPANQQARAQKTLSVEVDDVLNNGPFLPLDSSTTSCFIIPSKTIYCIHLYVYLII